MHRQFAAFLCWSCTAAATAALLYHARFLFFVDFDSVLDKSIFDTAFYFLTGLGHESFAVFFVADGIVTGILLLAGRRLPSLAHGRQRQGIWRPALKKLAALYAVLLPGLLLGALADTAGVTLFNGSGLYTDYPALINLTLTLPAFAGNLLMLEPAIVPTFGSNAMLYLLAYLAWSLAALTAFAGAAALGKPLSTLARVAIALSVLLLMPYSFLPWMAIWLLGIAVVLLGESGRAALAPWVGMVLFLALLLLSRVIGSQEGLLSTPLGGVIGDGRYVLVGAGFAVLARALYPRASLRGDDAAGAIAAGAFAADAERRYGVATFLFFFHMPLLLLLVGASADLLGQPLMRQPDWPVYAAFAAIVAASCALTALFGHAVAAAVQWLVGASRRATSGMRR